MAAKIAFVFVCAFAIFQTLEAGIMAPRDMGEDYEKLSKPIEDAFFSVKTQLNGLVDKIKSNPLYERASESVNEGYDKAKASLTEAYTKIEACKDILNLPVNKTPVH